MSSVDGPLHTEYNASRLCLSCNEEKWNKHSSIYILDTFFLKKMSTNLKQFCIIDFVSHDTECVCVCVLLYLAK